MLHRVSSFTASTNSEHGPSSLLAYEIGHRVAGSFPADALWPIKTASCKKSASTNYNKNSRTLIDLAGKERSTSRAERAHPRATSQPPRRRESGRRRDTGFNTVEATVWQRVAYSLSGNISRIWKSGPGEEDNPPRLRWARGPE